MAGFLYFKPKHEGDLTLAQVREWGLAHAFDAKPDHLGPVSAGPHDEGQPASAGMVFSNTATVRFELNCFKPAQQTWHRMPGLGGEHGLWLGWWNDKRPGPVDLKRFEVLAGYNVKLVDGADWLIPIVRGLAADGGDGPPLPYCTLPRRSCLGEDRNWSYAEVAAKHAPLWALAMAWLETVEGGPRPNEFDELHKAAVMALRTNYRMGDDECSALGLLDEKRCVDVMFAMCDGPQVEAWHKKKAEGDGLNSSAGAGA